MFKYCVKVLLTSRLCQYTEFIVLFHNCHYVGFFIKCNVGRLCFATNSLSTLHLNEPTVHSLPFNVAVVQFVCNDITQAYSELCCI